MRSAFLTPLNVKAIDDERWELTTSLVYKSDLLGKTITVPAGFITDFASVPRLPLAYWLMGGVATKAAVIHDFLYRLGDVSRKDADKVFAEAMEATGIPAWRRGPMWLGVRIFGRSSYKGGK